METARWYSRKVGVLIVREGDNEHVFRRSPTGRAMYLYTDDRRKGFALRWNVEHISRAVRDAAKKAIKEG